MSVEIIFDKEDMPRLSCEHCHKPITLADGIIAGKEHPGDLHMMDPSVYHKGCLHWMIELHGPVYLYCALSKLVASLLNGVAVSEAKMANDVEAQRQAWYMARHAEKERAESER